MVCSSCGYENQVGNRFCGMCGTPLPHRPLIAPGAQSTANLTRPVTENASSSFAPRTSVPQSLNTEHDTPTLEAAAPASELVPEVPLHEYVQNFRYVPPTNPEESTMRGETSVLHSEPAASSTTASLTPMETATVTAEPPPTASDEDVQERLGLEASSTPDERTDRPRFLDFNEPPTRVAPTTQSVSSSFLDLNEPPKTVESAPTAQSVSGSFLGLNDPPTTVAPTTQSVSSSFLDLNEPPKTAKAARTAQNISGPSFLGLNDPPPVEAGAGEEIEADEYEADEPRRGIWRIGLALIVVAVFGWLGVLEWRAQVSQANDGPVEVVKMKMRSAAPDTGPLEALKRRIQGMVHRALPDNAKPEPTPQATPPVSVSKPDMQVESPKPEKQNPEDTATSPPQPDASNGAATTPPASSAPANNPAAVDQTAGQSAAAPAQNPAANTSSPSADHNAAAASKTTATAAADKSKLTISQPPAAAPSAAGKQKPASQAADDQEVVVRKIAPGADELAKADNASDGAAEAAWLWKATAKGNPTAPVRLADMYVRGEGVPRSCEQALVLLKTAAEKENSLARNQLASMYSSGVCVPRNRVEAYRWVSSALSANPNSQWAQQRREQLWDQMTTEERTLAQKYR